MHVCQKPTTVLVKDLFASPALRNESSKLLEHLPSCFDCAMLLIGLVADRQSTEQGDARAWRILDKVEEKAPGLPALDKKAMVLAALGEAWYGEGRLDRAQSSYRSALAVCNDGKLKAWLTGPILVNLANVQQDEGHNDDAIQSLQLAIESYSTEGHQRGLGEAYGNLANVYQDKRRLEMARDCRLKSLDFYRAIGNWDAQADGLTNLALIYADMGDLGAAIVACQQAISILDRAGDALQAARSLNNLGLMFKAAGEMEGAQIAFNAAMKAARRGQDMQVYAVAAENAAAINPKSDGI